MGTADTIHRKQRLMARIQTEGAEAAYEAALAVCRDPKAPAQAKSTASATILRAGGYFNAKDTLAEKEIHEMDAAELDLYRRQLENQLAEFARSEDRDEPDGPGVFE